MSDPANEPIEFDMSKIDTKGLPIYVYCTVKAAETIVKALRMMALATPPHTSGKDALLAAAASVEVGNQDLIETYTKKDSTE